MVQKFAKNGTRGFRKTRSIAPMQIASAINTDHHKKFEDFKKAIIPITLSIAIDKNKKYILENRDSKGKFRDLIKLRIAKAIEYLVNIPEEFIDSVLTMSLITILYGTLKNHISFEFFEQYPQCREN